MVGRIALFCLALALAAPALAQQPTDPVTPDGEGAFFAALDLKEAGDCEGAIARFELALSRDPGLIQSHLYIAECCVTLGLRERAVAEVQAYLAAGEPAVETERARGILGDAGVDPDAFLPPEGSEKATGRWTPLRLELGGGVAHFDNAAALTAAGPTLSVRLLPLRFLEIGVRARMGFGPHPDLEGSVQVPEFHGGIAASIPLGAIRIVAGPMAATGISRYGGETRMDVGVLGEAGVRIALGDTRLVFGATFLGGWLVRPVLGGELTLGLQLGPKER